MTMVLGTFAETKVPRAEGPYYKIEPF